MRRAVLAVWKGLLWLLEFLLTPIIERNPSRHAGYDVASDLVLSSTSIALLAACAAAVYRVAAFPGSLGWPDAFVFAFALLALILKRKIDLATPGQAISLLRGLIDKFGRGDPGIPLAEQEAGSRAEVEGQEG